MVTPTLPPTVPPSKLSPLVAGLAQPTNIVKVLASGGCGDESEGTGFYVTGDEVITDAHVLAGQKHVTVNGVPATVALFDAKNDLAILRVGQRQPPYYFVSAEPSRGTTLRVIGFPLNGSRTQAAGYYEGGAARGRDAGSTTRRFSSKPFSISKST